MSPPVPRSPTQHARLPRGPCSVPEVPDPIDATDDARRRTRRTGGRALRHPGFLRHRRAGGADRWGVGDRLRPRHQPQRDLAGQPGRHHDDDGDHHLGDDHAPLRRRPTRPTRRRRRHHGGRVRRPPRPRRDLDHARAHHHRAHRRPPPRRSRPPTPRRPTSCSPAADNGACIDPDSPYAAAFGDREAWASAATRS